MKTSALVFFTVLLTFGLFSCIKDNPVPPDQQPQINLTLEDVSCTEAWLKLTTANITLPADVELLKDGIHSETISLTSADTILYVDSLLPNKTYILSSIIQSVNRSIPSNVLSITTLDTTSHNFTFQTWTFGGDAGSCTLYDVSIIDENNIWAVGEIDIADTSINGYTTYNAVHWNGSIWELIRINALSNCNPVQYPPLKAIFAFSESNIVITSGGSIGWFNGFTNTPDCSIRPLLTGSINKIWGANSDNLYAVGTLGTLVRYQNGQWSKIVSGTDLNINDISGYSDGSGNRLILCAASDLGTNHQKKLLRINNDSVDTLSWQPQAPLFTVWPGSLYKIYAGGGKTYANSGNGWVEQTSVRFFSYKIRGNGLNDVYAVGVNFSHFNGYTWKDISGLTLPGGTYLSVAGEENISCAVGFLGNKALISLIMK